MNNEYPTIETLMTEAYNRYASTMTQQEFWDQLNEREKVAVFVGNMNYQVENGGWSQWVYNEYSDCAGELIKILKSIGSQKCLEVAEMVQNVAASAAEYREGNLYWDDEGEEAEDPWSLLNQSVSSYDDRYYELQDAFLPDIENYLKAN